MKTLTAIFNTDKQLTKIETLGFKLDKDSMRMLYSKVKYDSKTVTIEPLSNPLFDLLGMGFNLPTKIVITKVIL